MDRGRRGLMCSALQPLLPTACKPHTRGRPLEPCSWEKSSRVSGLPPGQWVGGQWAVGRQTEPWATGAVSSSGTPEWFELPLCSALLSSHLLGGSALRSGHSVLGLASIAVQRCSIWQAQWDDLGQAVSSIQYPVSRAERRYLWPWPPMMVVGGKGWGHGGGSEEKRAAVGR